MTTTTTVATVATVATVTDLFTTEGSHAVTRLKKGKAIDKARHAMAQGADARAVLARAPAAARKDLVATLGAESVADLSTMAFKGQYGRAIATVAGVANFAFSLYVEAGKSPTRGDWKRLQHEMQTRSAELTDKGNPTTAAKEARAGLALWNDIQEAVEAKRLALQG